MSRFNNVAYHPGNGTVDVGAGLIWDDVYGVLDPLNITVAGGRITTVGVAGFTLGGGKTSSCVKVTFADPHRRNQLF
jgi:FAD/FMN-containing dehydrogenase